MQWFCDTFSSQSSNLTEKKQIPLKKNVIYSLHCGVSLTEFDMSWAETMYKEVLSTF